jgi:predicted RND superfamily exporter protein
MYLAGYELGVAESVAVVVQIGLSVDYVVHLSTDYMHSPLKSRNDKMRQAYKQMGISIFSGTLTTFGSGAFLFGGQLTLFRKFAVLITSTICLSFACSMLLFGALSHLVGPENGYGDILKSKKKDDK